VKYASLRHNVYFTGQAEQGRRKKFNIHIHRAGGYEQQAPPQGREPFSLLQLAGMKK